MVSECILLYLSHIRGIAHAINPFTVCKHARFWNARVILGLEVSKDSLDEAMRRTTTCP